MGVTLERPPLAPTVTEFLFYLIAALLVIVIATPVALWMATTSNVVGPLPVSHTASFHPVVTTAPIPALHASAPPPVPVTAVPVTATAAAEVPTTTAPLSGSGCAAALSYLTANAAPGFQLVCPGDADGAQALTCIGQAPCAPNQRLVVIADPCPAAYMNEAHNSWVLLHNTVGTPIPGGNTAIDPYGHC
jgi:hypothetical protein